MKNPFRFLKFGNKETPEAEVEESVEDTSECTFSFMLREGELFIFTDWTDGTNISDIGNLIGILATGEAVNPLIKEVMSNLQGQEESFPELEQSVKDRIQQHQEEEDDDDEPVVQPINAIRHQIVMYQPQQSE